MDQNPGVRLKFDWAKGCPQTPHTIHVWLEAAEETISIVIRFSPLDLRILVIFTASDDVIGFRAVRAEYFGEIVSDFPVHEAHPNSDPQLASAR